MYMYSMTIPALKFVIKTCSSVDIKLKCVAFVLKTATGSTCFDI